MSENKISVIIPIYNTEQYLDRCIESIVNQTYKNLEIILVDDGSTDNSGKKCDEWACKDSRIRVIHKENGGVSSARNEGLKQVTGDYIGWVDSDDWIEPDMYRIMLEDICKNASDVAVCAFTMESNKVDIKQVINIQNFDGRKATEEFLKDKLTSFLWDKLYKAELFQNISFKGQACEDSLANSRVFFEANKVTVTNYIGYHYIDRFNSLTHDSAAMLASVSTAVIIKKSVASIYPALKKWANYRILSGCIFVWNCMYKDVKMDDSTKRYILCNLKDALKYLPWVNSSVLAKKRMIFGLLIVLKNIF